MRRTRLRETAAAASPKHAVAFGGVCGRMTRMARLFVTALVLFPLSLLAGPRFGAGSVSREGPRGGSVEAEGFRAGRVSHGSVSAEGPNGGSYDASGTRVGRYRTGNVSAEGPNGGSVSKSGTAWTGYRRGYVYTGGVYRPAAIQVNTLYVAPVGAYVGWNVMARPYYVSSPSRPARWKFPSKSSFSAEGTTGGRLTGTSVRRPSRRLPNIRPTTACPAPARSTKRC